MGAIPPTNPAQGVIATSPATAPDAAPSVVALVSFTYSTRSQPSIAADAARKVFISAAAATPLAASAEPALNPAHPNHRMPVPIIVMGKLCGGIAWSGYPLRFPRTSTSASAAAPALMCTTAPPAKSSAPISASQPPANTQCATGAYTRTSHTEMNTAYDVNFSRSAVAPVINAGVMIANVIWNAQNSTNGMARDSKNAPEFLAIPTSCRNAKSRLPSHP